MLGSLLDAAAYNRARGAERVALFESGRAYLREGSLPQQGVLAGKFVGERPSPAFEPWRIGALVTGSVRPGGWREDAVEADFYALKGALEGLARQLGAPVEVVPGDQPFLHPGRSGRVLVEWRGRRLDRRDPPARLPHLGPGERRGVRDRPGAAGGRLAGRGRNV